MADIYSHYNINTAAGVMAASGVLWGGNALQTVTVAKHYPRDPQQAIGLRGVVDYTTGVQTTDVTLDCILTEQSSSAVVGDSSIYTYADQNIVLGSEVYVLTSCNMTFTAGAPATVSYGYITAGAGSSLTTMASPSVLVDGEESYYAVVMGDDGSGIELVENGTGSWVATAGGVVPSGCQSLTFGCTINKDNVLDVRVAQPIKFVTTYPLDLTVDVEVLDTEEGAASAGSLTSLGVIGAGLSNHADRTNYTSPSAGGGDFATSTSNYVLATGLVKVDESETVNVGGFLTYTFNYLAADIAIPLES